MSPIASGESPAFWASTPKARPMGTYPRQMGQAARIPSLKMDALSVGAAWSVIFEITKLGSYEKRKIGVDGRFLSSCPLFLTSALPIFISIKLLYDRKAV
jgi:hypothetical protein